MITTFQLFTDERFDNAHRFLSRWASLSQYNALGSSSERSFKKENGSIQSEHNQHSSFELLSLRFESAQNRWILVEFIPVSQGSAQLGKVASKANIDGKTIWAALKQSVLNNFGDTGWGAVGLSLTGEYCVAFKNLNLKDCIFLVKYFSPTTNLCIIRVARDHHNMAWAAVTLLTTIEGMRYIPNVIHLSGM